MELDSELINEIVCKVKSQGLFDQFRRECLADVDTKPAYQNLQHRVESCVSCFLGDQKWNSQTNKNQLREKLRKLITEKSFFEAGIGRIVDQVVNPKLNTNFLPKIEEVAYKLMGVEKKSPIDMKLNLDVSTDVLLPIYELEQVSPESEKSQSNESKYTPVTPVIFESISKEIHVHDSLNEDLESPAFEPIEPASGILNQDDMDISDDDKDNNDDDFNDENDNDDDEVNVDDNDRKMNGFEVKSNLSSISGLTSNDSNNSLKETTENNVVANTNENIASNKPIAPEITIDCAENLPISENIISNTSDLEIIEDINQDSVLSQVSSTSRLSIVTNNNTNEREEDFESCHMNIDAVEMCQETNQISCPYGISEEAQMQKFNENSSSSNCQSVSTQKTDNQNTISNFDIQKEEIKFEGTERNFFGEVFTNQLLNQSKDMVQRKKNSNKSRSSSKLDDHAPYRAKLTSRHRSRSKDSNDEDSHHPNIQSAPGHNESSEPSTSKNQTMHKCSEGTGHITSHSTSEEMGNESNRSNFLSIANQQDVIPNLNPVVIDQILTGNELDLSTLIGKNQNDPVLSSIKQSLETKVKKPKVAANMLEAKRLTKIRKQIELSNQKKLEKATVLAKQYIRKNSSSLLDDTQGIELEFVCAENRKASGPIIFSPIQSKEINDEDHEEMLNFFGFETSELQLALDYQHSFLESVNKNCDGYMAHPHSYLGDTQTPHMDVSNKNSTEKQRGKTRYSSDELFKPRPLLCGLTRRRRGFNCNE